MTRVHDQRSWIQVVEDEKAVAKLAEKFSGSLETPAVIYLCGELGAGKTTFARAYVHSLGFPGYVKSPSYGLLETYDAGGQKILHLDLYRIEDPEELEYLAIRDLYDHESVLLVEWPDKGKHHLPEPDLVLKFGENNEVRFVECQAHSDRGQKVVEKLSGSGS